MSRTAAETGAVTKPLIALDVAIDWDKPVPTMDKPVRMVFGRPLGWWLIAMGVSPSRWPGSNCGTIILEVKRRRSGGLQSTLVTWVEQQGRRYLVTMAGEEPQWVKNMRAAGGSVTLRHGRRRMSIRLQELPIDQRAPILQAWYRFTSLSAYPRWHFNLNRKAPIEDFERIAASHPVFLVVPNG